MTISIHALSWLIGTATAVTALAPIVLLFLWFRDLIKRRLW